MSVPAFSDIAKAPSDLLTRDFYHLAQFNLELKTKAPNGVAFTTKGKLAHDGPISGSLESKYNDKAYGLTVTQGWATNNTLNTKFELEEFLTPGLKGDLAAAYLPKSGVSNAKLSLYFKQPAFNARAFFDILKPTFTGDVTLGHDGLLVGSEIGYDILNGKITKYAAALGYVAPAYSASITATNNLNVYSAAYYHKINSSVEAGAKATWDSQAGQNNVALELGTKYKLDDSSFAKAKVNSQGVATVSYSQDLRPGITLGLGLAADTQRFNEAAHKFGVSLTFSA
ncbi:mitochondrial outer membrane protein porin 1 [Trichomonascus vanleenenianus]|uniref:porin n=1 Tax=Trichomonascus vanleenenianus TaxID=2268995 RepID=UPI003ECA28D3